MSNMVERLAAKWEDAPFSNDPEGEHQARWWIAAIADELGSVEELTHRYGDPKGWRMTKPHADSARWLRSQAEGGR